MAGDAKKKRRDIKKNCRNASLEIDFSDWNSKKTAVNA